MGVESAGNKLTMAIDQAARSAIQSHEVVATGAKAVANQTEAEAVPTSNDGDELLSETAQIESLTTVEQEQSVVVKVHASGARETYKEGDPRPPCLQGLTQGEFDTIIAMEARSSARRAQKEQQRAARKASRQISETKTSTIAETEKPSAQESPKAANDSPSVKATAMARNQVELIETEPKPNSVALEAFEHAERFELSHSETTPQSVTDSEVQGSVDTIQSSPIDDTVEVVPAAQLPTILATVQETNQSPIPVLKATPSPVNVLKASTIEPLESTSVALPQPEKLIPSSEEEYLLEIEPLSLNTQEYNQIELEPINLPEPHVGQMLEEFDSTYLLAENIEHTNEVTVVQSLPKYLQAAFEGFKQALEPQESEVISKLQANVADSSQRLEMIAQAPEAQLNMTEVTALVAILADWFDTVSRLSGEQIELHEKSAFLFKAVPKQLHAVLTEILEADAATPVKDVMHERIFTIIMDSTSKAITKTVHQAQAIGAMVLLQNVTIAA